MAMITVTYKVKTDQEAIKLAKYNDAYLAIWDIKQALRDKLKHEESDTMSSHEALDSFRQEMYEILDHHGLLEVE